MKKKLLIVLIALVLALGAAGAVWAVVRTADLAPAAEPAFSGTEGPGFSLAGSDPAAAEAVPSPAPSGAAAAPTPDPTAPETYFDLSRYDVPEDAWTQVKFEDDDMGHSVAVLFLCYDDSPEARLARDMKAVEKEAACYAEKSQEFRAWTEELAALDALETLSDEQLARKRELEDKIAWNIELSDPDGIFVRTAAQLVDKYIRGIEDNLYDYEFYLKPTPESDPTGYANYVDLAALHGRLAALRDGGADAETILLEYYRGMDTLGGGRVHGIVSRQLDWVLIDRIHG